MDNFAKEAQKKSVTKMLGRAVNPIEWVRQMSSSKYRRLIAAVDSIDNIMRNRIMRLKPDLGERLHQARMALKNRDFRKVFQYANYILDSVNGVFIDQMDELDALGKEVYSEFSRDTMDEWERQQLEEELGVRKSAKLPSENYDFVSEAGVVQWLQEKIPTKKEIEGVLFDKIFRNMQGKQQEAARQALAVAEMAYSLIKEAFDALDSNRRDIVEYVKLARGYQKKLTLEKERLKRIYINYFPAEVPKAEEPETDKENIINQPTIPSVIPEVQPTTQPDQPQTTDQNKPILTGNENDPKAAVAINDLLIKAKTAIGRGDNGIGIALIAKASEICDNCGDEQRSINLIKIANDLNRVRGQTVDVCLYDDANFIPVTRFSRERIAEAFNKGYIEGTPKMPISIMVDGKKIGE
jgi:hypothetical protein